MKMNANIKRTLLFTLIIILLLSACKKTPLEGTTLPQPAESVNSSGEITATMYPEGENDTEDDTDVVDSEALYPGNSKDENDGSTASDPLPSDPQVMNFVSEDGMALSGTFYPAAQAPAPLIVLMHWARGNQYEFKALAPWLQNRGMVYQPVFGETDWLDPSWFPTLPAGLSYNVFTFTFRGCENGCSSFDSQIRKGWALDAQAAVEFASQQYGVDPTTIRTIGASIGADGAVIGCHQYNLLHTVGCLGSLSVSPGGYLHLSYKDEVDNLSSTTPAPQAWCLYAEEDREAAPACREAEGNHYTAFSFPGPAHGMNLLTPKMDPSAMQVLFSFITQ